MQSTDGESSGVGTNLEGLISKYNSYFKPVSVKILKQAIFHKYYFKGHIIHGKK